MNCKFKEVEVKVEVEEKKLELRFAALTTVIGGCMDAWMQKIKYKLQITKYKQSTCLKKGRCHMTMSEITNSPDGLDKRYHFSSG